ncbi:MAG: ATP synthase F1 subunit epsilon [Patescibacteria group bacterium]
MAQKTIQFEIVTPERTVLREEVLQVSVPTTTGEITVLPDHIPLVSILEPGVIEVRRLNNEREIMSVSGGFIEVMKDKVVILADTAERADELDEARIQAAQQRALDLKQNAKAIDDVQFADVTAKLEKELARLRAVSRWRKLKNIDSIDKK